MVFVLIGLVAGALAGVFGIGGGILIVPALILVAGVPQRTAVGTSLASLLLPVGAFATWTYYRAGAVDVRGALLIAAGLAVGAWASSRVGLSLPPRTVERAFAVLLVLVAIRLWWKS